MQFDVSLPVRELSPLEKSVQTAALRALQQYLLGEMDFVEPSAAPRSQSRDGEDGTASSQDGCTT
jgi:hypothetical protein